MNKEIEIKLKVKDLNVIKNILQSIGKFVKEVHQKDTYFTPHHRDFFAEKPAFEFLRIREQEGKNQVAYHRVIDQNLATEHSEEYETKIDSPKVVDSILRHLDMKERFIIEKHREYWECGNFEIVLDNVTNLGLFIEVEVINSNNTVNFTKQDCFNFLKQNNIEFEENITKSYPELFLKQ